MPSDRNHKLVRLNARLEKFQRERPILFHFVTALVVCILAALVLLVEWARR